MFNNKHTGSTSFEPLKLSSDFNQLTVTTMNGYSTDCHCDIPYCECNAYQHTPPSTTYHCNCCDEHKSNNDVTPPPPTAVDRDSVERHLNTLLNDMYVIGNWEQHNKQTDNLITFPKYLASKLTNQEIIAYMGVFNECACCSRHTGRDDLPDLPKRAKGVGQHEEPNACYCNCRNNFRHLLQALIVIVGTTSPTFYKRLLLSYK